MTERTFAQLLDHLFEEIHPPGRGPYTYAEVAEGIGGALSASGIQQLRTGKKTNPTRDSIKALANFFGVRPGYFFDEEVTEEELAKIKVAAAMRDEGIQRVALRASGLSADSLKMVTNVIEHARNLEGLPGESPNHGLDLND